METLLEEIFEQIGLLENLNESENRINDIKLSLEYLNKVEDILILNFNVNDLSILELFDTNVSYLKDHKIIPSYENINSFDIDYALEAISNNKIKAIKAFKRRIYFLMNDITKYIDLTSKSTLKYNNEILSLSNKMKDVKLDKILDKTAKVPSSDIFKDIIIATKGLFDFVEQGLNIGYISLKYLSSLKEFTKKDNPRLSKIQNVMINLTNKYLSKLPLKSLGLSIEIDRSDIYKNGFRIKHKTPSWEKDYLQKSHTLKELGYDDLSILNKRSQDLTNFYKSHTKTLDKLLDITNKTQRETYNICDIAIDGITNKEDKETYLNLFYVTMSLFYVNEIMLHKIHMWLDKCMKYHWIVCKKFDTKA